MKMKVNPEQELAVGFLMELAKQPEKLNRFTDLSREEQIRLSEGARALTSKESLRNYVEQI